ncbi:MAG: DMT family transporter [Rubrivivax sp.]|nr:MAG: DMT family transporter [Rubrivivax sp.]
MRIIRHESGSPVISRRTQGFLLATVGAIAFSGKAIVAKLMYRHGVDAFTVVGLRMAMALPFFLAMAWWSGRTVDGRVPERLDSRGLWQIAGLGFCGYYLASTLDFLGLQYISASLERAILYLNPTLVLLLGVLFKGERPRPAQMGAVLLAYAGVAIVWLHDWSAVAVPSEAASSAGLAAAQAVATGSLLVLGSALSYAVYLMGSGALVGRMGSLRLVGWASSVACVLALFQWAVVAQGGQAALGWLPAVPHGAATAPLGAQWAGIAWQVWALSLLNAIACTVLPVWMVMRGVQLLGASVASQVGMVGPLSTIWMAAWVLGEPITGRLMLGTAAILIGIVWLAKAKGDQAGSVRA